MTTIGIIRHGSTHWNKEGRAQGSSDIPLDSEGLLQAQAIAERLSKEEGDLIYSSNLIRARQTAEIIGQKLGINDIEFDSRLREAKGGQIEGTTEAERIAKWGMNWRDLDLGIEGYDEVTTRGLSILEEIAVKHNNKNVLIISHGSFIRQLLKRVAPYVNTEEGLRNTALSRIKKTDNGWDCTLYNCSIHLG